DAITAFQNALRCDPKFVDAYMELARAYRLSGDLAAMAAAVATGLTIAPTHPTFLLMSAEIDFSRGALESAWRNYRQRFHPLEHPITAKAYPLPHWDGGTLAGKSVLIWTEQAPGDEIMYASMFADVIAAAGRCVIQCSPRVSALFRRSFPGVEI